jgi:folate-dependent phosphoribosylglycinamide formyltransferase PurN
MNSPADRENPIGVIMFGSPSSMFSAACASLLYEQGMLSVVVIPGQKRRGSGRIPLPTLLSAGFLRLWQESRRIRRKTGLLRSTEFLSLGEFLAARDDVPAIRFSRNRETLQSRLDRHGAKGRRVLVCCGFPRRIPADLRGFQHMVNIHPGILPQNRGPNPFFWTLAGGHTVTGVSVHLLTAEFDAGDILLSAEAPVPHGSTEFELEMISSALLDELVPDLVNRIDALVSSSSSQGPGEYHGRPSPEDRRKHGILRVLSVRDIIGFLRTDRHASV